MTLVPDIVTVAGNGTACSVSTNPCGDGGAATSANLNNPEHTFVDGAGNLYISEYANNRVRKVSATTGIITTVAGNGTQCPTPTSTCGDGGAATSADLYQPNATVVDSAGNIYIADRGDNRIRKVSAGTGYISTVAGTGTACTPSTAVCGDGGAATSAELNNPIDIAVDGAGNLYIADFDTNRIRKVTAGTGDISTVAGNGTQCASSTNACGDGGVATSANLYLPRGVAVDSAGDIYISDNGDNRIRLVMSDSGDISTIAGNGNYCYPTTGACGDGGAATSASLASQAAIALDLAGNLYIGDQNDNRVRKIAGGTGIITTVAGTGTACSPTTAACGDGGVATSANLNYSNGVFVDNAGNLYISDSDDNRVRKVFANSTTIAFPTTGISSTSAVTNIGIETTATETVTSVSVPTSQGADQEFSIGTITGCTVGSSNPINTTCVVPVTFKPSYPGTRQVPLRVVTGTGNIDFSLTGTGTGPLAALTPGEISTVAGTGTACAAPTASPACGNTGSATSATLNSPNALFVDNLGNVYVADSSDNQIRKFAVGGTISTVAGNGTACAAPTGACGDGGAATSANLNNPTDVYVDGAGDIYIADYSDQKVRKVTAGTGIITTVAGTGTACPSPTNVCGDGEAATSAELNLPSRLSMDGQGNLYIVDFNDNRIRMVGGATGLITTVAGTGTACAAPTSSCGDGGSALLADLNVPRGIFVDGANNIYISDDGDNRVRKVQALNTGLGSGNITTVAGTGTACAGGSAACGDGAAATSAELNAPHSIWVDAAGNIYIADTSDNRVRKVAAGSGYIWTVAGNGTAGYVADGVAATGTELNQVKGLGMDSAGNLFLADTSNNRIREVNIAASQLTFPTSTAVGTLDATDDPQTAMVSNLGNASLTVATPASGTNPTVPASYLLDAATTCPELNTSSSPGTLAAGSDCAYAVDLDPAQTGALDGSVVLTDNSLAVTGSTQTISTSGTGIAVSTTTTLGSSANPSTYGGSVTFTATVAPVSGSAVPTGTAQFSIDGSNVGSPVTLSSGTATYATSTLTAAAHSVTAAYTTNSSSYNSSSSSTLTQTVNKATPTVSVWPTAGAINYGQTLASSTLTGGTASVGGTFAWTTPSTAPGAGTPSESVTFTPTDTTDYNTPSAGSVSVTVHKVTPTVSVWPTAGAINYGQTLASSTLTGGTASVGGTFAWTTPSTAPGAGTPSESVTFTPTDTTDYNTPSAGSVSVTVNKVTPTVSVWPTAGAINYGQTLASSTLTGGTASVGGTFAWTTPSTAPGAGTPSESVTFTPTDSTDYNTPSAGSVSVTVNKATPTVSVWPTAGAINYGQTLASSTLTGGTASVGGTFAWTTPSTAPGAGTPSESVTFTPTDSTDYNTPSAGSVSVTVNKVTPTVSVWPTAGAINYGQTLASSTLTGGTASVGGTFAWTTPSTAPGAGSPSESVTFTPTDSTDYNTPSAGSVSVTVNKVTPTVSVWPTAGSITAGQTLASSTLSGGTASVGGTFAWTTPSTAPGAGTPSESVTFTPTDSTDYNTPSAGSVSVTVNAAASAYTAPTTNVGSTSATQTATVNFSTAGTLNTISVVTQGAAGLDYAYVAGGTCSTGTSYSVGQACSVEYTFTPTAPGQRLGAVVLSSSTPTMLGTSYLSGSGTGPQLGLTPGIISTVAGTGTNGYSGDGNLATAAKLNQPYAVALDGAGNLYIADYTNNRVRMVAAGTGDISTYAGNGTGSYSGDGSAATGAELSNPSGVAVDGAGNVYIADQGNNRIRMVNAITGIISTVAGNGTAGYLGNGTSATSAELHGVNGVTVDSAGNLYICDSTNEIVRKVTSPGGIISTVAGTAGVGGSSGDGSAATSAELNNPEAVVVDPSGNLYIADAGNRRVRLVNTSGTISNFAGTQGINTDTGDGGAATSASIAKPWGLALDAANDLYIVSNAGGHIRMVNGAGGIIGTIAGNGTNGYTGDGGVATSAELYYPEGMALDSQGNLYIAQYQEGIVRKIAVGSISSSTPLSFSSTTVGQSSTAANETVNNIGNAQFTISSISVPTNFSLGGAGTTCSTSGQSLASAASCVLGIEFAPASTGSLTGSVTLTDNALNASSAAQNLALSGTGLGEAPTIAFSVSNQTYGVSPFAVSASSNSAGTITYSVVSGPASISSSTVTITGAGTVVLQASQAANGNYLAGTQNASFTVNKATPTVSVWPTASAINYGQTLASSTLTGGTATVGGTFAWTTPSTAPGAGSPSESVTFTPTDSTDYNTPSAGSVSVTVNKVTPTVSVWPTASAINYGQTLASSTLTGGTASVGGTFAWTTPSTAPGAGSPSESVTFTPTDSTDYNTPSAGSVSVTVNKVTPTVSVWPTASAINYGQTLASSTLTGGTASVGGTFAWTTPSTAPGAGTPSESVTFTPTDTTDYNTPSAGSVSVTVNKVTPTVSVWPTAGAINYGQTLASSTLTGGTASVGGTFAWTTPSTAPGAGSPSESVTFTPTDSTDYNTPSAGSVSVTVHKSSVTVNGTTSLAVAYFGDNVTLTFTFAGSGATPTGTTTILDGENALGTVPLSSGVAILSISTLSPGGHTLTAVYNGDDNYE